MADRIIDTYIDDRNITRAVGEDTAEGAVTRALAILALTSFD